MQLHRSPGRRWEAEKKLCIQAKRPCTTDACPAVVPECDDDCTDCKIHAATCHKCAAAECLSYEEEETTTTPAPLTGGGTCDDVLVNKVKEMLRAEAELKELEQRVAEKKQLIETLKAQIMPDPIPPRK